MRSRTGSPLRELLQGKQAASCPAPFVIFWHRAGNTPRGIDAVHRACGGSAPELDGRPIRHGLECDLKWTRGPRGGALHLYLYHGLTGSERLGESPARRREASGSVISLERALDRPHADALDYMVEVKRGHGPRQEAVAGCVDAFERRGLSGHLLLARSSFSVLADIRRAHPDVPRCLFASRLLAGGRALHVPKIDMIRGLASGIVLGPRALCQVDAVSSLGPLRSLWTEPAHGAPAQLPRVSTLSKLRAVLAGGSPGAFAYFQPTALTD